MDLIDRAALGRGETSYTKLTYDELMFAIEDAPTIEAVPLEPLCEWLAEWDIQIIPCNVCKNVFQLESCPHGPFDCGDSEHLKMLIRKWMEGQHDHN